MDASFIDEEVTIKQLKTLTLLFILTALITSVLFLLEIAYFIEFLPFLIAISIGLFITSLFYFSNTGNRCNIFSKISKIIYLNRLPICCCSGFLAYKMLGIF